LFPSEILEISRRICFWFTVISTRSRNRYRIALVLCILSSDPIVGSAAVRLDSLGAFLTSNGYGGAQMIDSVAAYHLPILSNGKRGNLLVDTGAPSSLIFRASLGRLGLTETRTNERVKGAFGEGDDSYGVTVVGSFTAGNCTLANVPVAVAPHAGNRNLYGRPDGLLGLREMVKFGAILDLNNRILYLRPNRPGSEISRAIKSILEPKGWRSVDLSLGRNHLRVSAKANDVACHLLVDTGSSITSFDRGFASSAKIASVQTHITAHGLGKSSGEVSFASVLSLWLGSYQGKQMKASVVTMNSELLGRGSDVEVAGLVGVDYLYANSAIFDFVSGTLYLRPRPKR
jgi:predicted aspartyl protease